jgi:glutamate-1-semialdehyde 2,1-aminomutase
MEKISPLGPVYQAGTLSGNPLSMAAGIATLEALQEPGFYEGLEAKSAALEAGLRNAAEKAGVKTFHTRVGSVLGLFFTPGPVVDYTTASKSDTQIFTLYFHEMLNRGVYLAPSQFECSFVSAAHTNEQIESAVAAATEALQSVAERSGA